MEITANKLSGWIRERSGEMGFAACGISTAGKLEDEQDRLQEWLLAGMHGEMGYMERNLDKRLDPGKLVEGARSVISFLYNYFPVETLPEKNNYVISKYAYGRDYHTVIRDKLHQLVWEMRERAGSLNARVFTDSAPVLERAWARRAGLGWIGKNTCLIHPKAGSYFFLAEIITDLELEPDTTTINDLCGGCTRCLDGCPTGALIEPRVLDARKCISYLTIEYKGVLPVKMKEQFGQMIFGCDICQDVCPWNRFAIAHKEPLFRPSEELRGMDLEKWEGLGEDDFRRIFGGSALERAGFHGIMRNVRLIGDKN